MSSGNNMEKEEEENDSKATNTEKKDTDENIKNTTKTEDLRMLKLPDHSSYSSQALMGIKFPVPHPDPLPDIKPTYMELERRSNIPGCCYCGITVEKRVKNSKLLKFGCISEDDPKFLPLPQNEECKNQLKLEETKEEKSPTKMIEYSSQK
jgi:hypothetical protein